MLSLLNVADGIYSQQIGVQFVLSEATGLTNNGTLTSTDPVELIVAFRNTGLPNPGVSHLFSGRDLQGSTVGIAYVGSLCRETSVGLTQRLGSKTSLIFAHELGHNFGAPHDNQSGSACSDTPSGFVMNPNINSGGTTFSNCSIEQMQPTIAQATGICIVDVAVQAPTITSIANLEASIGIDYLYDSDSIVEASGTAPFTYTLDIAPIGMTIDASGKITWLPTSDNVGINTVQVRVSNAVGSDVQIFDLTIEPLEPPPTDGFINFNEVVLSSYDNQDITNSASVGVTPFELVLTGNTWKSIQINYEVTPDTIIQFDFKSDVEAEIHGVAFDNDNYISASSTFRIYGVQNYGILAGSYSGSGSTQSISIPIGEYIQGSFDRLVFILDNDANKDGANSIFSNVIVFEANEVVVPDEPEPEIPTINFNEVQITSHMPNSQDFGDNFEIIEQGKGLRIEGNSWKKVILDSTSITPSTLLSFDFKSDSISEIHGLGFYTGDVISSGRTMQIAGVQNYGIRDFTYSDNGQWQSFVIPIGTYFTSDKVELVFILDNDKGIVADSSFRNVEFIDQ
jgi:hypothetical protein